MSKGIYLTRDDGDNADYEIWEGGPLKDKHGVYWDTETAGLPASCCAEPFERITGFHLEPGEIVRIPRKRFKELFKGLKK